MAAADLPLGGHFLMALSGFWSTVTRIIIDPMTATQPLEDDQPLGRVQSHRVNFNADAPPAPLPSSPASAAPVPRAPFRPADASEI